MTGKWEHLRFETMLKSLKIIIFLLLATAVALEYCEAHRSPEEIFGGLSIIPAVDEGPRVTIEEGPFSVSFVDIAAFIARDLKNRRISKILILDMYNQDNEITECGIGLTLALFKGLAGHPYFNVSTAAPPLEARSADSEEIDVEAILAFGKSMNAEVVCAGKIYDNDGLLRFELEIFDVNSKAPIISVGMPLEDEVTDASTRL